MTLRIGIVPQNIRQPRPRGVARVARAIVEELARNPAFDCYVFSHLTYDRQAIMAQHFGLVDYLACVPLDLTPYAIETPAVASPLRSRVMSVLGDIEKRLMQVSFLRPLVRRASSVVTSGQWHPPGDPAPYEARCTSLGPIPLSSFDVVLSFEAFEEIWEWPVESIPTKFIVLLHDAIPFRIDEGPNGRPDHFLRAVSKSLVRADHVVCNSFCTERDAHIFFPASRKKTSVIHLGHFPTGQVGSAPARAPDEVIVTMLGDMDRRKNLQGALRSMQLIAEGLPGRRLVLQVIGNAGQRADFLELEREASKFGEVRWTGYLPDADRSARLKASDVFLFPSLWEGFGIPILEAMELGVPVVCSGLSSMPEVGGEFATYIADPYEPQVIAEAVLKTLALSPAERAARIEGAKVWASQFTWQAAADKWSKLIVELAATPKFD